MLHSQKKEAALNWFSIYRDSTLSQFKSDLDRVAFLKTVYFGNLPSYSVVTLWPGEDDDYISTPDPRRDR